MPLTRAQIAAEIATNLANNSSGDITAAILRTILSDISAAAPNIADDQPTALDNATTGANYQDSFTGNGSTTVFTLSHSPAGGKANVTIDGLTQTVTTDYSISGTTLTFVVAPNNLDAIQVYYSAPVSGGGGDMVLADVQTVTGAKTFGSAGAVGKLKVAGTTSGAVTLDAPAVAGSGTVSLPTTGTLATLAGTETLTNKTLTAPVIATIVSGAATSTLPTTTDTLVGRATTDTLSNKTLVAPALGTPASGNMSNCTVDGTNLIGYRGAPQLSKTADYTFVLGDAGFSLFHPSSDNNARTFTIPANSSVAFPIGTIIEFINMAAASATIAITTDTLTLLPAGTTGSRTLAQFGRASAEKVTSTSWIISGNSALS